MLGEGFSSGIGEFGQAGETKVTLMLGEDFRSPGPWPLETARTGKETEQFLAEGQRMFSEFGSLHLGCWARIRYYYRDAA